MRRLSGWIASVAITLLWLAASPTQAQALFPGGCPNIDQTDTISYSFNAGSAGAFTDGGGTPCLGNLMPGVWRYRYTYVVTSTLVDATFRIQSVHGTATDITAPGTYEVVVSFPGTETDYAARRYGDRIDVGGYPTAVDDFDTQYQPQLGLGYSTTVTGPAPSGAVTVTVIDGTIDVPGGLITFTASPPLIMDAFLYFKASTGVIRVGGVGNPAQQLQPNTSFVVGAGSPRPLLLDSGTSYTFTQNPNVSGHRLASITCTGVVPTVDITNRRFTVVGPADRAAASCHLDHAIPPTITGISPASGPITGGTVVTLTGTNLGGVTAVNFGAFAATSFSLINATTVTAVAPVGAVGPVNLSVGVGGLVSADSASDDFTYLSVEPPPPPPPAAVPTLSEWAMILLGLLLAGGAALHIQRRKTTA